jgi:hypothetical protein
MTRIVVWIALCLASAGCGSSAERQWIADDFNKAEIESGQLLVAGVVAVPELHRQGHGAERAYTERLDTTLRERRPDLPLVDHHRFVDSLDLDTLDAILSRYRERGSLDPQSLTQLTRLAAQTRYAVFARLEDNREQRRAGDTASVDSGDDRVDYSATYESKRVVVASFDVFDVAKGQLVWTAQLTKDDERSRTREYGSRDLRDNREVEPNFRWSGSGGFPEAPDFLELLSALFGDFAAKLPR